MKQKLHVDRFHLQVSIFLPEKTKPSVKIFISEQNEFYNNMTHHEAYNFSRSRVTAEAILFHKEWGMS